jgi:hypothetical protein
MPKKKTPQEDPKNKKSEQSPLTPQEPASPPAADAAKGKPAEAKPKTETAVAKTAEVVKALKCEVTFPMIANLKQALGFDKDGNLVITVQFQAPVDQFETFRLVNLLKQPHGALYAVIGSPQTAMDFIFDKKKNQMDIIQAASKLLTASSDAQGTIKTGEAGKPADAEKPKRGRKKTEEVAEEKPVTNALLIQEVSFNHMPDEQLPFGVTADYLEREGGEVHSKAGRGKDAYSAVVALAIGLNIIGPGAKQPFEIRAALETLKPTPALYKLVRVVDTGSFEEKAA